jgi:hypothetical protein
MSFPPRIKYEVNSSGPPAHRASGPEEIQIASRPKGPPSGVELPLGWNLAQREKTGFRIKSGMTKCVKSFMKHYTSAVSQKYVS